MARKKKSDVIEVNEQATVVKGSHLTVYTYADGSTRLEWDDAQLLKDVQDAIASVETTQGETNGKTRKTRKSK